MKLRLSIVVSFLSLVIWAQLPNSYYNGIDFKKTGDGMKKQLSTLITNTHTHEVTYNDLWEIFRFSDQDPENPNNILLVYGSNAYGKHQRSRMKQSSWNREHVYAKSLGTPNLGTEGAGADAHHLRPADIGLNSTRNNRKFDDGTGPMSTKTSRGGWFPGDEWKGDVARILMYMYLRYPNQAKPTNVAYGPMTIAEDMPDILLKWNVEDPVSEYEMKRNDYIQTIQHNRNPFVDNPYLATIIWGGDPAENKWSGKIEGGTEGDVISPSAPQNLEVVSTTESTVTIRWEEAKDNIKVFGYHVFVDGKNVGAVFGNTAKVRNLESNTSYDIAVKAFDTTHNKSELSEVIKAKTEAVDNSEDHVCGKEDFEKIPTSKFYTSLTWENNDITWAATDSRSDNVAYIDGNGTLAACIRSGSLTSSTIQGGINSLTVQTQLKFNGKPGNYTLFINGEEKGKIPYSEEPNTFTIRDINVSGEFTIEIQGDNTNNKVSIDNLSWRCNDSSSLDVEDIIVEDLGFTVYPNPIRNQEFYVDGLNNPETLYIYNINGALVKVINKVQNKQRVRLGNLPKGVYIINTSKGSEKVIVE